MLRSGSTSTVESAAPASSRAVALRVARSAWFRSRTAMIVRRPPINAAAVMTATTTRSRRTERRSVAISRVTRASSAASSAARASTLASRNERSSAVGTTLEWIAQDSNCAS